MIICSVKSLLAVQLSQYSDLYLPFGMKLDHCIEIRPFGAAQFIIDFKAFFKLRWRFVVSCYFSSLESWPLLLSCRCNNWFDSSNFCANVRPLSSLKSGNARFHAKRLGKILRKIIKIRVMDWWSHFTKLHVVFQFRWPDTTTPRRRSLLLRIPDIILPTTVIQDIHQIKHGRKSKLLSSAIL